MAKREKDYSCNPAKCSCKNGKYSIIIIGNSVVMCHKIIETTKTIPTKGIPTKNDPTRSITTKNISEKTSPMKNTLMEKGDLLNEKCYLLFYWLSWHQKFITTSQCQY